MSKITYSEKLKDPRWQRKRLEAMERDNFTCIYCLDSHSTLNVHHLSYKGDPWDQVLSQLQTLCEHCHGIVSLKNEKLGKFIKVISHPDTPTQIYFCFEKRIYIKDRNTFISRKEVERLHDFYKER